MNGSLKTSGGDAINKFYVFSIYRIRIKQYIHLRGIPSVEISKLVVNAGRCPFPDLGRSLNKDYPLSSMTKLTERPSRLS